MINSIKRKNYNFNVNEIPHELNNLITCKNFTTPCIAIISKKVISNYKLLKDILYINDIYYSIKANTHPDILKILYDIGSSFEVCNESELNYLLNFGFNCDKILYSPIICSEGTKSASKIINRIVFNRKNIFERIFINDRIKFIDIYLRVYCKNNNHVNHSSTIGFFPDEALSIIVKHTLRNVGLAIHVGSGCNNVSAFISHINCLKSIKTSLNGQVKSINLGGGIYNTNYSETLQLNEFYSKINSIIKEDFSDCNIVIEPGRFIVSNAGYLITKIIDTFKLDGKNYIRIDSGIYNGLLDVAILNKSPEIIPLNENDLTKYTVIGPTNDSKDKLVADIILPRQKINDLLLIPNSGAYTNVLSTNFCNIGQPMVTII